MIEDWAIIGLEKSRPFRKPERVLRFAGGRSRHKLQWIAKRMNGSGDYQVDVRFVRMVRKP